MRLHLNFINIGSWNMHGLFQKFNSVKICKLDEEIVLNRIKQFDILALQETWCSPKEANSIMIDGFKIIHLHRRKSNNNRYYGGMSILIKNNIRPGITFLTSEADRVWIKLDHKFFGIERDAIICFVYVPPKSAVNKDPTIFDELSTEIESFKSQGNILACGDFNAKTNSLLDFVNDVNDQHSPINNNLLYDKSIPIGRQNCDPHPVDDWGKAFLELCKSTNLKILNGRTQGDRAGNFTRWPNALRESPSTLDYALGDSNAIKDVMCFQVLDTLGVSDHCCTRLRYKVDCQVKSVKKVNIHQIKKEKCLPVDKYLLKLQSADFSEKLDQIIGNINNNSSEDPSKFVNDLTNLIMRYAVDTSNTSRRRPKKKKAQKNKPNWYNTECTLLKNALNRASKNLAKNKFDRNSQNIFFSAKKSIFRIAKNVSVQQGIH